MKFDFKSVIKYLITLFIGGLLLYLVFSKIDLAAMVEELKKADYRFIVASMLISLLAHLSRAYRWNLLMKSAGYSVKLFHSFQAVLVAYFANMAFPRLGEVSRCSIVKKTDNVPLEISLGTVITERIVDVIMSGLLLGLCFLLEFNRLKALFISLFWDKISTLFGNMMGIWILLTAFIFFISICVWILYKNWHKIASTNLVAKVLELLKGLLKGLLSIKSLENKWQFVFHSFFIWFIYFFITYIIFFSMEDTSSLGMTAGLVAMVLGAFGMAAPVQGGIGTYHIMVSSALLIYGIPQEKGVILATILHTSQALNFIIFGGISTISVALMKNNITK
jgi:uncharacterized protein (TIRG00374 family)